MSGRLRLRRGLALAGAVALVSPVTFLSTAPVAAAAPSGLFQLEAQGDGMYFQADSLNAPGSPKNQAGSLTARAETNSAGNSFAFAGAPYYGPTVTTLPGTGIGLVGGATGIPVPSPPGGVAFPTTLPGFVSSRFPAEPSASSDMGGYEVKAESAELSSKASGRNGAPGAVPAPNQQQSADAMTLAADNGTITAVANAAVRGISFGPITGLDARSSAKITENGNRKPVITSEAFGKFDVGGMSVLFDREGFTVAGQNVPAKDGLVMINQALAGANMKVEAVPSTTVVDPGSGRTTYTIGGLRITTIQQAPQTEPATLVYEFARSQVSSLAIPDAAVPVTDAPVLDTPTIDPAPPVTESPESGLSSDPGLTSTGGDAPAGDGTTEAPVLSSEPSTGGGAPVAAGPAGEAPLVLGAVSAPTLPTLRSETQLIYLVLVLGGLGAFVGSQLFRRFGIGLSLREASA